MREWWRNLTPKERRAKIAARDPARVRREDARKQAKRRVSGSPEQKLRIKARDEVRKARLRGDLVPGPCERQGDGCQGKVQAHHDDYAKPLEVRWLCRKHHDDHHDDTD